MSAGNVWHNVPGAQTWDLPDLAAEDRATRAAAEAQERKLHTAGELDELQRRAYREGFERGHADGLRTGTEAGRDHARRIAVLLEALADPLRQVDLAVERTLVGLVLTLVKRLVREAAADPACLEHLVHDAVEALADGEARIKVALNPEDRRVLRAHFEERDLTPPWTIIGDGELQRADVRVLTDIAEVDARLDSRLQRLQAEMLGET